MAASSAISRMRGIDMRAYTIKLSSEEVQRLKSIASSSSVQHELSGDWPEKRVDKKILSLIISADSVRFQDER